ncbi:MAG: flagellar biosynthesis protein FlhF [Oligoflexia bacterium]|nr:flagellar biosynthesis protein FlhF [Oligoflexia bacterium]
MQVKKFEAPTIQEALDTIKRELGPDAIILQTKKYKRGFGLMSRASIEVTAAVSERSLQKKHYVEKRLPESAREAIQKLPAEKQAELFAKSGSRQTAAQLQDRAQVNAQSARRGAGAVAAAGAYQMASQPATQAGSPAASAGNRRGGAPVDQLLASSDAYVPSAKSAARPAPQAPRVSSQPQTPPAELIDAPRVTSRRYAEIDADEIGAAISASAPGSAAVNEELRHLKRMIEELKSAQDSAHELHGSGAQSLIASGRAGNSAIATPALQGAFEQLVINGLDKRYALSLIKTTAFELGPERSESPDEVMDQLAVEIMKNTRVISPFAGAAPSGPEAQRRGAPLMLALVGPTGVGKTTTVAKLASEAILKRNLRVGLINLDSYKIAAFDQLGTYAKILNVPFRSVSTADELRDAIRDFQSLDLVLIDTTGRSQRDPSSLTEMQQLLASVPGITTQLVLSVTTRDAELYDMSNRFSVFRPQGLIVSKLDESTSHGAIYNVSTRAELPLLYFTTGQRVPEDIEGATRERVAALLLDL